MSALMRRAGEAARAILEQRAAAEAELGDRGLVAIMLAEAYARGFIDGLEQAGDLVRIEREACEAEISRE